MDLHAALASTFGRERFRPHQEQLIRAVLEGGDGLGVHPTGAGTSLCHPLPAWLRLCPTLVVSSMHRLSDGTE